MHRDHEYIQILAYRIWEGRGRPEGTADQDWLEAERQLSAAAAGGGKPGPAPDARTMNTPKMKLRMPASTQARPTLRASGPVTDGDHASKKQEPGFPGSS
jgi:hypothetical protein